MSRAGLIATTRPLYWQPACRCRNVGYTLGATREFRASGKICGPKGSSYGGAIVRVETIPGPSCDNCGKAWLSLAKAGAA